MLHQLRIITDVAHRRYKSKTKSQIYAMQQDAANLTLVTWKAKPDIPGQSKIKL
jgi:hypothetical protein